MNVEDLNQLAEHELHSVLENICVSPWWINAMMAARPFENSTSLLKAAVDIWQQADKTEILAAFDGHPRIGDVSSLKEKYASSAHTAGHEQAGMNIASDALLQKMKQRNDDYFNQYGFIFIVYASGKSAEQMLALLEARMNNSETQELTIAAAEQGKIMVHRLTQMLAG